MSWRQRIVLAIVIATAAIAVSGGSRSVEPPVYLWAWETPTDLRDIDSSRAGVAFLAGSLVLRGDDVGVRPRMQPLRVAEGTRLIAAVRIDVGPGVPPSYSTAQQEKASRLLVELVRKQPGVTAVQVDFDAPVSGRSFYAGVLAAVRSGLPPSTSLSMTALASWCSGDPWIAGLPVDEVVPMLFRMGPDSRRVRQDLASGRDFKVSLCRHSIGLSTDEPLDWRPAGRRVYLFNPRGWNAASAAEALQEYRR